MEKPEIPIVVVAFNKTAPLQRLLQSLTVSTYPTKVKLIISIDGGGSQDVLDIAENFSWKHGDKEIISHKENMGLRKHILSCGELTQHYAGIIMLEDDLFVSSDFYNFALQAAQKIENEKSVCGLALYSPAYNETSYMPFRPLYDGTDGYYMQLPCSWGQLWLKNQWKEFRQWYNNNQDKNLSDDLTLPHNIRVWPPTSWKKFFVKYMIENDKFFLYPYESYTTNFGDFGQHHTGTLLFQVPLVLKNKNVEITPFNDSLVKYDAFCEITPQSLKILCPWLAEFKFDVDLHGAKENKQLTSEYAITSKKSNHPLKSFGKYILPIEQNILNGIEGSNLVLTKTEQLEEIEDMNVQVWHKSNDFDEQCYYYSLDRRHLAKQRKKIDFLKERNNTMKDKLHNLEANKRELEDRISKKEQLLSAATQEITALRNSYSYRLGKAVVTPFSHIKRLLKSM